MPQQTHFSPSKSPRTNIQKFDQYLLKGIHGTRTAPREQREAVYMNNDEILDEVEAVRSVFGEFFVDGQKVQLSIHFCVCMLDLNSNEEKFFVLND